MTPNGLARHALEMLAAGQVTYVRRIIDRADKLGGWYAAALDIAIEHHADPVDAAYLSLPPGVALSGLRPGVTL